MLASCRCTVSHWNSSICATLSLKQFSQLLFDQGIYASNAWDRSKACPVNSVTLSVWLRQAREAGLLPQKAMPSRKPAVKKVTYPRAHES